MFSHFIKKKKKNENSTLKNLNMLKTIQRIEIKIFLEQSSKCKFESLDSFKSVVYFIMRKIYFLKLYYFKLYFLKIYKYYKYIYSTILVIVKLYQRCTSGLFKKSHFHFHYYQVERRAFCNYKLQRVKITENITKTFLQKKKKNSPFVCFNRVIVKKKLRKFANESCVEKCVAKINHDKASVEKKVLKKKSLEKKS